MARIAVTFEDTEAGVQILVRHEHPPGAVLTPAEKTADSVKRVLDLLGELKEAPHADRV